VSAEQLLNVLGNSLATIVIARTEHAVDIEILQSQLKSGPDEGVTASAL
jgi:Na+/H+-dicarboxylate symporter